MLNVETANLLQIAAYLETGEPSAPALEERLRAIHEEHRWIPVSERMPTKDDGNEQGFVLRWSQGEPVSSPWHVVVRLAGQEGFKHWQRITPPKEGE
jgi:hypothetical protein